MVNTENNFVLEALAGLRFKNTDASLLLLMKFTLLSY